ncbi:hypothetical protein SAY87_006505 [Trapa incisa]|uniref:Uncharacterized protein n=1 Tax=Trapa incisa TaxID=236973 RepID=A0AAN7PZB4_9MYRT|nr:hypothetical protein SAY87_006505 [Trapa incisa]
MDKACCSAGSTCFLMSLILSVFVSGYTCTYRTRLRAHYSLQGDQCEDFCIHLWCFCCAICQEHRELQARGLDPSKGWDANMRKMQRAPLPPVMRR